MKASADFLCKSVYKGDDNSLIYFIVEIKARVTTESINKEKEVLRTARNKYFSDQPKRRHQDQVKYFTLRWEDPLVQDFIPSQSERAQLLHLCSVYSLPSCMLVVGSNSGEVLHGVFVSFDDSVRSAWRKTIGWCAEVALEPMVNEDWDSIKHVVNEVTVNQSKLDVRSLKIWWWLYLNTVGINGWTLPLPPCSRVLPKIFAVWNSTKGASDTISKVAASAEYRIPTKALQPNVVAVMIHQVLIAVWRLSQLSTAKSNLRWYDDIYHYRHNASARLTHKSFLFKLKDEWSQSTGVDNLVVLTPQARFNPALLPTAPTATRAMRDVASILPVSLGDANRITGSTPLKLVTEQYEALFKQSELTEDQKLVLERRMNCRGPSMAVDLVTAKKLIAKDKKEKKSIFSSKGICAFCGKRGACNFCFGCHLWFHDGHQCHAVDQRAMFKFPVDEKGSAKKVVMRMTCWSLAHPCAYGQSNLWDNVLIAGNNKDDLTLHKSQCKAISSSKIEGTSIPEQTTPNMAMNVERAVPPAIVTTQKKKRGKTDVPPKGPTKKKQKK